MEAPDNTTEEAVVEYGIHIMMLSNGKPHAEVTGAPSYAELLRLISEVEENMRAELMAERVVSKLTHAKKQQPLIVRPGA